MASGRARQRKRFQSVPTTMAATWKLKDEQAVILEGFVKHGTNDAVNWFVMPIRTPQGLIDHDVRFKQSPLESCSFNGGFWSYSANIEIKERQILDHEGVVATVLEPYSFEYFVNRVQAALDSYEG
ncbi:hypothetical protein P4S60_09195 [Pseudoalteromonas sp. Hal040]|uniref:hypothetical protein n=1 Tax=unclassified Pseudoalteromonas TaxID=194690 RepID=UPI00301BAB61